MVVDDSGSRGIETITVRVIPISFSDKKGLALMANNSWDFVISMIYQKNGRYENHLATVREIEVSLLP